MKSPYEKKELRRIATALNRLVRVTEGKALDFMNVTTYEQYYSETHYVDFHETAREFRVYKRTKDWEAPPLFGSAVG